MYSPEVIKFITDSRKLGTTNAEIALQLFNLGWDDQTVHDSVIQIANEYEQKKRQKLWS